MSHTPRKRFGQNFLHDQNIIGKIIQAIQPRAGQHIVEIGPGQGALTEPLIARCETIDAIELDRDLVAHLGRQVFGPNLTLHSHDALEFNFTELARKRGGPLRIVGNLPYNISTPLLFHLLDHADAIVDMHFMLQKEVVERMAAEPGSKAYGRLTVILHAHCDVLNLFPVGPGAFNPPPKVWSAIARLTPNRQRRQTVKNYARFKSIVTHAFSQRRKTLSNSLKPVLDRDALLAAGISPKLRAEQLTPEQFIQLANLD